MLDGVFFPLHPLWSCWESGVCCQQDLLNQGPAAVQLNLVPDHRHPDAKVAILLSSSTISAMLLAALPGY